LFSLERQEFLPQLESIMDYSKSEMECSCFTEEKILQEEALLQIYGIYEFICLNKMLIFHSKNIKETMSIIFYHGDKDLVFTF